MLPEKYKILVFSSEKFFLNGVNKVTMDDLAKEMKISKKTIYKHFDSKKEIIRAILDGIQLNLNRSLKITNREESKITKLILTTEVYLDFMNTVSEKWLLDLRQSYPDLLSRWNNIRINQLEGAISKVVEEGKAEGLILDLPNRIISKTIHGGLKAVLKEDSILEGNLSPKEAGKICLDIIISGILTKKGKDNSYSQSKEKFN